MLLCPARQTGTGRILNLLGKNGDSFSILDRLPFFFFMESSFSTYPLLDLFLAQCA